MFFIISRSGNIIFRSSGKLTSFEEIITTQSVVFMVRTSEKKKKCSVPCSVLFSSRYIDEKKIFRQRFVSGSA